MRHLLLIISLALIVFQACDSGSAGTSGSTSRQVSENGFEYIHHYKSGNEIIKPGEGVEFHVYTRAGDSILFSSRQDLPEPPVQKVPLEGQPNNNPTPVFDAFKLMAEGDSMTIFLNLDSLPQRPAGMEDVTEIAYDLKVVKVMSAEDMDKMMEEKQAAIMAEKEALQARRPQVAMEVQNAISAYKSNSLKLNELPSGLKIHMIEEGSGAKPDPGKNVNVHYYGALLDNNTFDNSFERGQAFNFPLGQGRVIKGWDEGIATLNKGSKAILFIPSEMGYGAQGSPPSIPADAELVFYVELLND